MIFNKFAWKIVVANNKMMSNPLRHKGTFLIKIHPKMCAFMNYFGKSFIMMNKLIFLNFNTFYKRVNFI